MLNVASDLSKETVRGDKVANEPQLGYAGAPWYVFALDDAEQAGDDGDAVGVEDGLLRHP